MDSVNRPEFCQLTPPGAAAVAVTGLRGAGAELLIRRYFRPRSRRDPAGLRPGEFRYGSWGERGMGAEGSGLSPAEDLLVVRLVTGEFEIHSHGGWIAPQRIAADLLAGGAVGLDLDEWLATSLPWFRPSCSRALGHATTLRMSEAILAQERAWTDWSQWQLADARLGRWDSVREMIAGRLALAERGERIARPLRIVLYGPPNAGKSSLLNALAGFDRSIVHESPGTTRDLVSVSMALGGWPVELLDSAGLRRAESAVEEAGIRKASDAVDAADLRLLVVDVASPPGPSLRGTLMRQRPQVVVWNKVDLGPPPERWSVDQAEISVLRGLGVEELAARIARELDAMLPDASEPLPFDGRLVSCLENLARLAEAESLQDFAAAIGPGLPSGGE